MDLKESDILGDAIGQHWYYASKAKALETLVDGEGVTSILDVGAGSGFFSRHLLSTTRAAQACCVDPLYEEDREERIGGKPLRFRRAISSSDADLVLMMDVLEHVDDDVGLLREYALAAREGATFLISVPAFAALWSEHDEFLEHKRRYTATQLEQTVRAAGLVPNTVAYFFGAVLPLAFATRTLAWGRGGGRPPRSQLKRHSRFVNTLLKGICFAEVPLLRRNRLAGLTVFCVASNVAAAGGPGSIRT